MKKLLAVLIIICLTSFAFAEYVPYKHGVDLSIGGPASGFSMEYQYNLVVWGLHTVGVSASWGKVENGNTFPLGMQYRFGKIHQLELGGHITPIFTTDPNPLAAEAGGSNLRFQLALTARLGYRININRFFMHIALLPSVPEEHTTALLGFGFYFGPAVLDRKIEYYTPSR